MPSQLTYDIFPRCLRDVMGDKQIQIPEHQRPEMWDLKRQERLIGTIMTGLPMPNLTLREELTSEGRVKWLEDGHQRYSTIKKFMENRLAWKNRFYREFTPDEIIHFQTYKLALTVFENATRKEVIEIFDSFQNGMPLRPGHRFHSQKDSLLVSYVRQRLMTPGEGLYDRAAAVWGPHSCNADTKTKKHLTNAMALGGGVAHGVEFIVTSYDILGEKLEKPFDTVAADRFLEALLSIYERSHEGGNEPNKKEKAKRWDVGYLSGYILYSLMSFPSFEREISDDWVEYLIGLQQDERTIGELHAGMPKSRNWNAGRWRTGCKNLFPYLFPDDEVEEVGDAYSVDDDDDGEEA